MQVEMDVYTLAKRVSSSVKTTSPPTHTQTHTDIYTHYLLQCISALFLHYPSPPPPVALSVSSSGLEWRNGQTTNRL